MFKIVSKLCILAVVLLFLNVISYSQVNSTGRVKAGISDIPGNMNAGETYKVQCTITNISQELWSSENLHAKEHGPFEVIKDWSTEWKLNPGESTTLYYSVTAPQKSGKFKLRITFYDNNKKVGYKSRTITVASTMEAK